MPRKMPAIGRRGITAAMALMSWAAASASDGDFSADEWTDLVMDVVGPQIREVVVERANRLSAARIARGTVGRSKVEAWTDPILTVADGIRFRDWATSALADGRIDEGEIMDLVLNHITPYVIEKVADAMASEDAPPVRTGDNA